LTYLPEGVGVRGAPWSESFEVKDDASGAIHLAEYLSDDALTEIRVVTPQMLTDQFAD
jgi:hypothetical protein